ncbi:homoserine dehydrogenase [Hypnocyclicus thermotrophus]|uniref:Homoserine dehydrogenase n=1 Tax=Hypnocyclicus thermotrophus TaxID=1627895 RepID=A0AA46DZX8_9FUSO|nr:homoserine dehydrogenase [Hypnocyclicus thermotrophus]TDT72224.1 homoserine dehydrogenase [Hypnocyclicus thermotrophus]
MKIALLGYGTVGSGVYDLVIKNREKIRNKYNEDIEVIQILDRNIDRFKDLAHYNVFVDSIDKIINGKADIVIEMLGGVNPAYDFVKKSLLSKKHVITSNKDLIAEHGEELRKIARESGVRIAYEASVGGGIPVLKPLKESLVGNDILSIQAIINGTTNFILSKMYNENMEYSKVLKIAQDMGFAEADPTSDVKGYDAARKITILTDLGLDFKINWKDIYCEGIDNIDAQDIINAKNLNSKIKLIAFSKAVDNKLYIAVRPVVVKADSTLGKIDNEFNGVMITGDSVGEVLFYGKGAGKYPTASAVFGDIVDIIINKNESKIVLSKENYEFTYKYPFKSDWLVRVDSDDINKVTGKIFDIFSSNRVEITSFLSSGEIALKVSDINEYELEENLLKLKETGYLKAVKYFLIDNA